MAIFQLASLPPTYLTADIHLVSEYGRRLLHSSTNRTLTVPRIHDRFCDKSFAVAGPRCGTVCLQVCATWQATNSLHDI